MPVETLLEPSPNQLEGSSYICLQHKVECSQRMSKVGLYSCMKLYGVCQLQICERACLPEMSHPGHI